jgi:hypothetical protein
MILPCLADCDKRGTGCLAVTLQNERGGRQRCFAHDASAVVDETDPVSETGVTYYEKICVKSRGEHDLFECHGYLTAFLMCAKKWFFLGENDIEENK